MIGRSRTYSPEQSLELVTLLIIYCQKLKQFLEFILFYSFIYLFYFLQFLFFEGTQVKACNTNTFCFVTTVYIVTFAFNHFEIFVS